MPIINVTTWPTSKAIKVKLMQELTRVLHEVSGAPLDKITVVFQEIDKSNWADAGVIGTDEKFAATSRRLNYDNEEIS